MKWVLWAAMVIALLVAGGVPLARAASPAAADQSSVALEIDVSTLEGTAGPRIQRALSERLTTALRATGLGVATLSEEATILVRVQMPDVDMREYAISIEVLVEGEREVVVKAASCLACPELQLIDEVEDLLPAVLARIRQMKLEAREAPAPELLACPEERSATSTRVGEERGHRGKGGPLGLGGVGALAAGVAAAGAGGLIAALPTKKPGRYIIPPNTRTMGFTLVGVGATVAVLGIAALVVDRLVLERRRSQRRVDAAVETSPTSAGLWTRGSF